LTLTIIAESFWFVKRYLKVFYKKIGKVML